MRSGVRTEKGKTVVDASIAVKWVVPEEHSDTADRLLATGVGLHAPAHWLAEAGTALWAKSAIEGVLTRRQVEDRVEWLSGLAVEETPVRGLLAAATAVSFDLHLTVYDALYLALAERIAAPLVTADRKLHDEAKASARWSDRVVWVADVPAG